MAIKIYGTITPNVQRAILALFEAEVDVDNEVKLVLVSVAAKETKHPAFLAKQLWPNPHLEFVKYSYDGSCLNFLCVLGLVPCYEEGDLLLFESRAISRYVAEKYQDQGAPLLGTTVQERAIINQWCEVESLSFNTAVTPIVREFRFAANEKRPVNEQLVASQVSVLDQVFGVYEAQLSKHKYLAGDKYTLVDLFHIPMLSILLKVKNEVPVFTGHKHVMAWAQDLVSRPAFLKTLETNTKWAKEEV